ncbi:MAG: phospholipase D-like domain-containing protein, partial [Novosphingobium sp.]
MAKGTTRGIALAALGTIAVAAWALRLASRLPACDAGPDREPGNDPETSSLARAATAETARHPGRTGLHLLSDGLDAFAARLLLVRAAEATLDLQYYIWHGDRTGTLLLEALHAAAERGVRVRLLVDDNGIAGLDRVLAALDGHPRIAVRIFNPFRIRFPKAVGYLVDFHRLNRRMHNKSVIVDGAVTVIGGRNIGDEYFGAGDGALFADLDVLAVGSAVGAVADDFERYWCAASAYPAAQILAPV